ncbi:MAG: MFS transporter, partial [Deltaproteobacteria bacterium]|nr:MFS transporter [Nannocystaceae bacterium]
MTSPRLASRPFVLGFIANFAHSLALHSYVHYSGRLEQLGADELTTGVVLATMAVSAIAARPMLGRIMDAHGRRVVLLVGSAINVVASALYLTVVSISPWLYAIRLLHGIAEAMLFSVLFTIAADVVPPAQRTRGIALFGISGMIPLSLAGWLGDALLQVADYDALFVAATIAAAVGLLAGVFLPDSRPPFDPDAAPSRPFFRAIWSPPLRPLWLIGFTFAVAVASYFAFLKTFVLARGVGSVGSFFGAYTIAAIALRLGFGGLPDRLGARVTLFPAVACTAVCVALLAEAGSDGAVIVAGVLGGIGHGDGDGLVGVYGAIADTDGEVIGAGTLGLGGSPGEYAGGRIDHRAGGCADEAVGEGVGGNVGVGRAGGEGERGAFVDGLGGDGGEDRGGVGADDHGQAGGG